MCLPTQLRLRAVHDFSTVRARTWTPPAPAGLARCPCSPSPGTATVADPSPGRRTRHRGTQRPPPAVSAGRCRRAATILFPGDLLACLPRARPRLLLLRSSTPPWIQFHQPWLAAKPPQTHRCQPEADRDQQLFPELKGLRREGTTQQLSEEG